MRFLGAKVIITPKAQGCFSLTFEGFRVPSGYKECRRYSHMLYTPAVASTHGSVGGPYADMVQYNTCDDREMYDFARLHSPKLAWNPLKGPYEATLPQKQGLGFRGICLAQAQEQKICLLLGLLGLSRHSRSDIWQGSGRIQ